MRSLRLLLACALLAASLALVACGAAPETGPQGGGETPTATPDTSEGIFAAPGIYEVEGGKVQALGTLDYRDIEGGFWAVVDTSGPTDAAEAKVVAVIANAEDLGVDLEAMRGQYVSAIGKKLEGVSTRQAGPEIEAEKIEVVDDTIEPNQ